MEKIIKEVVENISAMNRYTKFVNEIEVRNVVGGLVYERLQKSLKDVANVMISYDNMAVTYIIGSNPQYKDYEIGRVYFKMRLKVYARPAQWGYVIEAVDLVANEESVNVGDEVIEVDLKDIESLKAALIKVRELSIEKFEAVCERIRKNSYPEILSDVYLLSQLSHRNLSTLAKIWETEKENAG